MIKNVTSVPSNLLKSNSDLKITGVVGLLENKVLTLLLPKYLWIALKYKPKYWLLKLIPSPGKQFNLSGINWLVSG